MIKLVFPNNELTDLASQFRAERLESFAFVSCVPGKLPPKTGACCPIDSCAGPDQYEQRSEVTVRPSAAFRLAIEKSARRNGLSLVYCHSHPREPGIPSFSGIDDKTEVLLATYSRDRVGTTPHIALLVGAEGFRARELGCGDPIELFEVGRRVIRHFPIDHLPVANEFDRQIRAFGADGQRAIQALRGGDHRLGRYRLGRRPAARVSRRAPIPPY